MNVPHNILTVAEDAAEQLRVLRSRLSSDTRHSFRSPLTVIDGTARRIDAAPMSRWAELELFELFLRRHGGELNTSLDSQDLVFEINIPTLTKNNQKLTSLPYRATGSPNQEQTI